MTYTLKQLSRAFRALSNDRRMMIIKVIAAKPYSVTLITRKLKLTYKTASFHLNRLEREGMVRRKRKGKYHYYSLTDSFRGSGVCRQILRSRAEKK